MAINFNGTNRHLDYSVSVGNTLGNTPTMTFTTWIKCDSPSTNQGVMNIGTFAGAIGQVEVYINANVLSMRSVTSGTFNIGGSFTSTGWNFIVARFDGTNGQILVNGALLATAAYSASTNYTGYKGVFGAYFSAPNYLRGSMFDSRIYNIGLTNNECLCIMNGNGSDKIVNGLIVRSIMCGKEGNTVTVEPDVSKYSNPLTVGGTPTYFAAQQKLI